MKPNMGNTDRIIRIVAAVVIAVLYFAGAISGLAATILLVLAALLVVTSFVSFCPLYVLLGVSTCRREA